MPGGFRNSEDKDRANYFGYGVFRRLRELKRRYGHRPLKDQADLTDSDKNRLGFLRFRINRQNLTPGQD